MEDVPTRPEAADTFVYPGSVDSGTAALIPAAQAGQVSASSDPRSFFDDLVACLDASGSSELAVADGVSELEFWGRRLAALCLVRPAA